MLVHRIASQALDRNQRRIGVSELFDLGFEHLTLGLQFLDPGVGGPFIGLR